MRVCVCVCVCVHACISVCVHALVCVLERERILAGKSERSDNSSYTCLQFLSLPSHSPYVFFFFCLFVVLLFAGKPLQRLPDHRLLRPLRAVPARAWSQQHQEWTSRAVISDVIIAVTSSPKSDTGLNITVIFPCGRLQHAAYRVIN